jgi:hypothetical protein
VSGHHPWPPPRKGPLVCVRFFGEQCDPENCCGGRDSRGRLSSRLLSQELIEERKLEGLTDEEVLSMWHAGRLRVIL